MARKTITIALPRSAEQVDMQPSDVETLAGDALEAACKVVVDRWELYGLKPTGDFAPGEMDGLEQALQSLVGAFFLNTGYGLALNADADDHPQDGYVLEGLEACAPESLDYTGDVTVRFAPERMVHGFQQATLYAPTRSAIIAYVLEHWGGSDEGWLGETLAEIRPVRPVQADREYLIHLNVTIPADGSAPSAVVALDEEI